MQPKQTENIKSLPRIVVTPSATDNWLHVEIESETVASMLSATVSIAKSLLLVSVTFPSV